MLSPQLLPPKLLHRRLQFEWVLVLCAACAFITAGLAWGWFSGLDRRIYDHLLAMAAPPADDSILIAALDDHSLAQLGRWPWSRDVHARLLDQLADDGAAATAYDVLFLEPSPQDGRMAAAMARGGPVFLPVLLQWDAAGRETGVLRPVPQLADAAHGLGAVQHVPDADGVMRRASPVVRTVDGTWRQLAVSLAPRGLRNGQGNQTFLVNFAGPGAFRTISFSALAAGEVPPQMVRDKLILVGATAEGMGDMHIVPTSAGGIMSGVEMQANILNTMLTGSAIRELSHGLVLLLSILPVLALLVAFWWLSPTGNLVFAFGLAAAVLVISGALLVFARLWIAPSTAVAGLALVHGLWGWRRLGAINAFVLTQIRDLERETPGGMATAGLVLGGDQVASEARKLAGVVDQLRAARHFLQEVLERSPDATCVQDQAGRIVMANGAAAELFGGPVTGLSLDQVLAQLGRTAAIDGNSIELPGGRSLLQARADMPDGHRIAVFSDITEIRNAAREREELLQFLSHDLRAPGAAIIGLLDRHATLPKANGATVLTPRDVASLRAHARHGMHIADAFVELARARRKPLAMQPVDVHDAMLEAVDLVWQSARASGIVLEELRTDGEFWAWGDRELILRAIANLMDNAVKFAPLGCKVAYGVRLDSGQVQFCVTGPGPDLPEDRQTDPFAAFAAGVPASGRSSRGLGLAYVQAVARRHSGTASYARMEGALSMFAISLPRWNEGDEV